jgi:y4mF family transcriptional regulator
MQERFCGDRLVAEEVPTHIREEFSDREVFGRIRPIWDEKCPIGKFCLCSGKSWLIISRTGNEKAMTSIRTPQQLGDALRAARKQLGLTQPQLALAAGVGVRFIVDLEAGKPTVRLENVLRVIDTLGGEVQLSGLPSAAVADQREGGHRGA